MILDRALDWIGEPRLPHHLPFWLYRRARWPAGPRPSAGGPVPLALSFDVEYDPTAPPDAPTWTTCRPFLSWLAEASEARGWRTTLFVQGALAEPLADLLRPMLPRHEIGLHGHLHELWGRPLWFGRAEATTRRVRRERLAAALSAFERAALPRPRSFRAPFLICDRYTLRLLAGAGFRLDSSAMASRGCLPLVSREEGLQRVPVSAAPRPRLRRRYGLPTWARFDLLNLPTFLHAPIERLVEIVAEVLAAQEALGGRRHLVVLAHPWEFDDDVPIELCSAANRERLLARVEELGRRVPLETATLSRIAGIEGATG
ncbi:MAG TPA: polysaccharide deacetylase family protein [Chloroflexota bacterium]|jgi:peptidoglycan/xylan/chitin deacetylase (PgdA/CDA1 family)